MGQQASHLTVGPQDISMFISASFHSRMTVVGTLGGMQTEIMLDSGSSISLIQEEFVPRNVHQIQPKPCLQLVMVSGGGLKIVDNISTLVQSNEVQVNHNLIVVKQLIAPVILGIDFLQQNCLVLDFSSTPFEVHQKHRASVIQLQEANDTPEKLQVIHDAVLKSKSKICSMVTVMDPTTDIIDECTIPKFDRQTIWDRPECEVPGLMSVVQEFKDPFSTSPGVTSEAHHYIPTSGSPMQIPPWQIPEHYRENIEE